MIFSLFFWWIVLSIVCLAYCPTATNNRHIYPFIYIARTPAIRLSARQKVTMLQKFSTVNHLLMYHVLTIAFAEYILSSLAQVWVWRRDSHRAGWGKIWSVPLVQIQHILELMQQYFTMQTEIQNFTTLEMTDRWRHCLVFPTELQQKRTSRSFTGSRDANKKALHPPDPRSYWSQAWCAPQN